MEGIRDLSGYYRALKKQLACPKSEQTHFLTETMQMAADYRQGNLDASEQDVIKFLGPPEELATVFLESMCPKKLNQYQKTKLWLKRGAVLSVTLVFCLLSFWCIYLESRPKKVEVSETLTITVLEEVES